MFGIPYASRSVVNGRVIATCPKCGDEFVGERGYEDSDDSKSAGRKYAAHYAEKHEEGEHGPR